MTEPIVLRNDVPMFERLLAAFFVAVGAPLTYLGFTRSQELPDLVVPVVQIGLPLFLIVFVWWAFAKRRRIVVSLTPGDSMAVFEERMLFANRRWTASVIGADIEMDTDIDGDPYGRLVLRIREGQDVVATEGNDIGRLQSQLELVLDWIGS